jgi:hypothetical protein
MQKVLHIFFISCAVSSSYSIEGSYKGFIKNGLRNNIATNLVNTTAHPKQNMQHTQYSTTQLNCGSTTGILAFEFKMSNAEEKEKYNNRIVNCLNSKERFFLLHGSLYRQVNVN